MDTIIVAEQAAILSEIAADKNDPPWLSGTPDKSMQSDTIRVMGTFAEATVLQMSSTEPSFSKKAAPPPKGSHL